MELDQHSSEIQSHGFFFLIKEEQKWSCKCVCFLWLCIYYVFTLDVHI